jgi:ribonuclease HI
MTHDTHIEIFCDGGSRGNPGHAAFGYVVLKDGQVTQREGGYIGIETNNFAEYTAIVKALSWAGINLKGREIRVYLDSQLAASQLSGIYKVKNSKIREFVLEIRVLEANFAKVIYNHVPREKNKLADQMVNLALDKHLYNL